MGYSKTCVSHQRSFSAMLSPDSVCRGVVKPCRSRRSKSKNILIKQRVGTMLPLTVASLYLGQAVRLVLVLGRRDAIRKEFYETPDMICELCCHRRGSLLPFAPQRGLWHGDAQRLMRAYEIGRCFRAVDVMLDGSPKLIAIDEQPNHQVVHIPTVSPLTIPLMGCQLK